MLKVISLKICPFVQRVIALLEAKKLPYEVEYIGFNDQPEWFLAISPNAQVPLLLTESGVPLFESEAIIEYIDDISEPLEQGLSAEQRALNRAWSYQADALYLPQCSTMQSATEENLKERTQKLAKSFAKVEAKLTESPFFNGEQFGNVDIAWLPVLHRTALLEKHSNYDLLKGFPKIKAWQTQLMKTGLAELSVSEDFESIFTGFYLSNRTFLGRGQNCDEILGDFCGSEGCCG